MATDNQSPRAPRQIALRAGVHLDVLPFQAHTDHAASADAPTNLAATRAAAAWGPPVDCRGRDVVTLFLTATKVSGQTGLVIAVQTSPYDSEQDAEWFDRHTTFDLLHGDAVAIPTSPRDLTLDVSGFADGEFKVAVDVRRVGNYMRFKPYGTGTLTGSRCKIEAVRVMEGS